MNLPQTVLINPHAHDFIFTPLNYILVNKRPLHKYRYLADAITAESSRILIFANISSLVPARLFQTLPQPLRHILLAIELQAWARLNNINYKLILSKPCTSYNTFTFAYKFYLTDSLVCLLRCANFNIVHLSHYFVNPHHLLLACKSLSETIVFAGDNDLRNNLFFQALFPNYSRPFLIIPFTVNDKFRFIPSLHQSSSSIVCTGSFHRLPVELTRRTRPYHLFMKITHAISFHHHRIHIYYSNTSRRILCLCTQYADYTSNSKLSVNVSLQKEYMKLSLHEIYNRAHCAYVGSEISGSIPIGSLEAGSCGAMPFLDPRCIKGLPLQPYIHYYPIDEHLSTTALLRLMEQASCSIDSSVKARRTRSEHYKATFSCDKLSENFKNQILTLTPWTIDRSFLTAAD